MSINKNIMLGMPTLIELNSLADNLSLCKELNLDLLEINMNLPQFQLNELQKIIENNDIIYSLHLPEELNVWDYNEKIRDAYIETIKEAIDTAVSKNINILNMHMNLGVYFTLPGKKIFLFEKYKNEFIENTVNFATIMNEILKESNIKICIENTEIYDHKFIVDAVNELLKYECFNLTWDIGHDYSSGNNDFDLIKENIDRVKHLHLHDAINTKNHLPLGQGKINLKNVITLVGRNIESIIFETKTAEGLKVSIEYYNRKICLSLWYRLYKLSLSYMRFLCCFVW